jgi:ubiquinone/menaquinone biosynthesis C-methylase UbiE
MGKEEVRGYFDTLASHYVTERQQEPSFIAQKRIVLEMLSGVRGRILEIGCGPALMAADLVAYGFEFWGIDAAAEMIRYARSRLADTPKLPMHLAVADMENLPYADAFFDAVLSMGTLEYLPTYELAIGEIARVLKPRGIAVINLPNRVCAYHLARALYAAARTAARKALDREPASAPAPNRCIPWQLDRGLARAGLRKVEARSCNFIFFPLHELHAGFSNALNEKLWPLSNSRLGHLVGTQYNVKAVKDA